ncbi:hypothetical protein ACO22_06468 [Paracoccidioides brasiliensis]|uniref:Uncharacterized protein n=1 Tax=Paracoccidioides brasiliensis TaxID=121759 RepID=A0A1D2J7P8_PARBR|nr:hypothetical protein ACO22_06468 [Paracoccidioides brasiliensis]
MQSLGGRRFPRKGISEGGQENAQGMTLHPSSHEPRSRRYEIRTLLDIGRRAGVRKPPAAVLNHPDEGSENRILTEKPINRRQISSNFSTGTEDGLLLSQANHLQYPHRQPINAPQGKLAQIDAGFARFLKEHASPKHQRVTAGGRIVPMNLSSAPAPEFKLPAISSQRIEPQKDDSIHVTNRPLKTHADFQRESGDFQHQGLRADAYQSKCIGQNFAAPLMQSGSNSEEINHLPFTSVRATSGQQAQRALHVNPNSNPGRQERMTQFAPETTAATSGYTILNAAGEQVGWVPNNAQQCYTSNSTDQPFPVAYAMSNGAILGMYPLDQSGLMMTAPPQLFPLSTIPINEPTINQPLVNQTMVNQTMVNQPMIHQSQPSNLAMPFTGLSEDLLSYKSLEHATREYDKLSDQLSSLDRYLALHSLDVDPAAKRILIDQRVELVMKLDVARSLKEQIESALQLSNSRAAMQHQSFGLQQFSNEFASPVAPSWLPNVGQLNNNVGPSNLNPVGYMISAMGLPMADSYTNAYANQARAPFVPAGLVPSLQGWRSSNGNNSGNHVPQNCAVNTEQMLNNDYTPVEIGQARQALSSVGGSAFKAGYGAARESAPPEIARVYQNIEMAASLGEPLGPLIEELALVARQLNVSDIIENQGLIGQPEQAPRSSDSKVNRTGLGPSNEAATVESFSEESKPSTFPTADSKMASVAPPIAPPNAVPKAVPDVAPNAPKMKKTNIIRKPSDVVDIETGFPAATAQPSKYKMNSYVESVKSKELARDLALAKERHRHNQLVRDDDSPTPLGRHFLGTYGSVSGSVMGNETNQQSAPLSNWKQLGNSGPSKKANTSTASSKVNAYGLLPRYDGADDEDDRGSKAPDATLSVSVSGIGTAKARGEAGATKSTEKEWYRKVPRKDVNPKDVREFFKLLREQEKDMIKNHRKESRRFG